MSMGSEGHAAVPPHGMQWRYEARPEDREAVRRIVHSSGFFSPAEIDVAVELVDDRLRLGEASEYYFVFADDAEGRTWGYTCYGPITVTQGSFDLYWIAVDHEYRGRGLGKRLLAESERLIAAAGGRRVYIETSIKPQYSPTRHFYERNGYPLEAVLKEFYGPGDDKAIYVKALPATQ
jgi:GNAT superfamily N-acetyltransferase